MRCEGATDRHRDKRPTLPRKSESISKPFKGVYVTYTKTRFKAFLTLRDGSRNYIVYILYVYCIYYIAYLQKIENWYNLRATDASRRPVYSQQVNT